MSKFKTSIPAGPGKSTPESGARYSAGKSAAPDAVLRTGKLPKPSAVTEAQAVQGAARRAIDVQVQTGNDKGGGGSDPHKRSRAVWGVDEK